MNFGRSALHKLCIASHFLELEDLAFENIQFGNAECHHSNPIDKFDTKMNLEGLCKVDSGSSLKTLV